MRRLAAALVSVLLAFSPATAYLVEVTTSVAVTGAEDRDALQNTIMTAVDEVLKDAIAFTPTLIVLTQATVVRGRLYVRLLVADADGERIFDALHAPPAAPDIVSDPAELRI